MSKRPNMETRLTLVSDGEACDVCARVMTIGIMWSTGKDQAALVCGDCLTKMRRILDAALVGFA